MSRPDIADYLIHFTKGESTEDAFQTLGKIVGERRLIGSGRIIKGHFPCVCFSEAPLGALAGGLHNPNYYSQYSPFGIMVRKQWLFEQGGRPVIYETDLEYEGLVESHRWRHMRYEPPEIDFSWEREWRIRCESLAFAPTVASIVVADAIWAQRLVNAHDLEQDYRVMSYSMVIDLMLAEQYREPFCWNVFTLR